MAEIEISFCIVNYNSRDYLRDCLHSLKEHCSDLTYEIIVVDNHSQDGTQEMLADEFPEALWIELPENEGYTRPMNIALKRGKGRYLVQLNPDTLVLPETFQRLVAFLERHPRVGICTPRVLNRDLTLQRQCRRSAARPWDVFTYFTGLSRLFPHSAFFSRYLMTYQNDDESYPVEAVSGSCMFIRRAVIEQIGVLDELFFAYQEDADFCFRARQAGWEIYYYPEARIIHYGGEGGSKVQPYRAVYAWHKSYYLYYRKNLARDYFFLVNWFFYLAMVVKLVLSMIATVFRRNKFVGTRKP